MIMASQERLSGSKRSKSSNRGGNTSSPRFLWCFTLNNPTVPEVQDCEKFCKQWCKKYVFQEEIGESGTYHLQGTFSLKKKQRFTALAKLLPRAHLEVCKSWNAAVAYCSDVDKRKPGGQVWSNMTFPEKLITLSEDQLYPWQRDVVKLIQTKPDDRKIHWYWEPVGCEGKSMFAKYLCIKFGCLITEGKAKDVKNQILTYSQKNNGCFPKVIIWDIPRTTKDYISWNAIEAVKNGCFYSGKYEGGMCIYNCPHILVFANFEPDYVMLSADRWVVTKVGGLRDDVLDVSEEFMLL